MLTEFERLDAGPLFFELDHLGAAGADFKQEVQTAYLPHLDCNILKLEGTEFYLPMCGVTIIATLSAGSGV